MTAGELIKELSAADSDTEVFLRVDEKSYELVSSQHVMDPDDEPFNEEGSVMKDSGLKEAVFLEGELP